MSRPCSGPPVGEILMVVTVVLALLAWPLVSPPIWAHGEAREGLVVRDIARRGDWVLPRRLGELPSKPPLFHWIAASAAKTVGLSDAAVRFPSALAGAVMAGATFVAGWLVGGRRTAWLALTALLGMLGFWTSATEARVDMVFASCVALALTGFLAWYRVVDEGGQGKGARAVTYLATAAGVLAKGPVGVVLPVGVIVTFLIVNRQAALLCRFWSWSLAGLVLVIDGGWYALAIREGGRDFIALQLLHENVDRFVGRGGFRRTADPLHLRHSPIRMELALVKAFFPWNLALVATARRWWRGGRESSEGRFLHVWWIAILLVFAAAARTRTVYLLPLAPAIAVLAARVLVRWLPEGRRSMAIGMGLACLALAVGLASQAVRVHQASRHSLAAFAADIGRLLPSVSPLAASGGVLEGDRLVLAYLLDRDIPRVHEPLAPIGALLVPARRAAAIATNGFRRVAEAPGPAAHLVLVERGEAPRGPLAAAAR